MIDATHTAMGLTLMSYTNGDAPALDAEIDGAIARRRGEPLNSNPYGYTPQSDNWEAGWIEEDKWLRFPDGPIYYGKPNYLVPAPLEYSLYGLYLMVSEYRQAFRKTKTLI